MNGDLLRNKGILITAGVLVLLIIVALLGMIYLGKPEVILLRAIDNISKSIENVTSEKIEKGIITTDTKISTDIIDMKDVNIKNISHVLKDGSYEDLYSNVKSDDKDIFDSLLVLKDNSLYIKSSALSEQLCIVGNLNTILGIDDNKMMLSENNIEDLIKIIVKSMYEQEIAKSKEHIDINGKIVKCTKYSLVLTGEKQQNISLSILNKINNNKDLREKVNTILSKDKKGTIDDIISENTSKPNSADGYITLNIYSKGLGELAKIEVVNDVKINSKMVTNTYAVSHINDKMMLQYNNLYINVDYSNTRDEDGKVIISMGSITEAMISGTIEYTVKELDNGGINIDIIGKFTEKDKETKTLAINTTKVVDTKSEITQVDVTNAAEFNTILNQKISGIFGMIQSSSGESRGDIYQSTPVETVEPAITELEEEEPQSETETVVKVEGTQSKDKELSKIESEMLNKFNADKESNSGSVTLTKDSSLETRTCAIGYLQELLEEILVNNEDMDPSKYVFGITVKKSSSETYICQIIISEDEEKITYNLNGKTVKISDEEVTGTVTDVFIKNK